MTTEHKAVLDPLRRLENQGFEVTLLEPVQAPNENAGHLGEDLVTTLGAALRDDTRLVSIMLANNEIGTIQPIAEIARLCHEHGVLVHCDATQAIGKMPVDIDALGVDMLSFSGHKMYGPRGIGALIVRRRRPRIRLTPLFDGGGQEQGRRSGTLNVPGIVGLAEALTICDQEMEMESVRIREMRDELYVEILEKLDGVGLNGPSLSRRLGGNLNLHFSDVDGEALMMNMANVAVSSGSACTSANPEPSHVLRAIGLSEDMTRSSLRFGIGRFNTNEDITIATEVVVAAVQRLRQLG
jgi:cysteine desulfurase